MNYFYDPHKPLDVTEGRNLPHWQQDGKISFVTFRLADALPKQVLVRMDEEIKSGDLTVREERRRLQAIFKYLDAGYGSCILSNQKAREIMAKVIMYSNGSNYELHAAVIMPNHVHILLYPVCGIDIQSIVAGLKSSSAHLINKELGLKGSLWQRDYFDRLIRNNESYLKTVQYINDNPSHCPKGSAYLYDPVTKTWHTAPL